MGKERRTAPRVRVNLPVRWEGVLMQQRATVTDLSSKGCFILTGGIVEPRELVFLEIDLPNQEAIQVWAEVVDSAYDIGFAVRFNATSDEDQQRLVTYIEGLCGDTENKT